MTRGLILRNIPYSDSSRIIRCFTSESGIKAYFIRLSKNKKQTGHLQVGCFIEFQTKGTSNGITSITESRPDSAINQCELHPSLIGVWLFTIELLNKSLPEDFHVPGLSQAIDTYYTHLSHQSISAEPLIPLILISSKLGVHDPLTCEVEEKSTLAESLYLLNMQTTPSSVTNIKFLPTLHEFQLHFNIKRIESLYLL